MLVGRPQIGKTGAVFHLVYLLWAHIHAKERAEPAPAPAPMGRAAAVKATKKDLSILSLEVLADAVPS